MFKNSGNFNTTLIYILLWTPKNDIPFDRFSSQQAFVRRNCTYSNCYITDDRKLFGDDFGRFDAVFVNGWPRHCNIDKLINLRTRRQKICYIFLESSVKFPCPFKKFNNFFNWTITYKLDSDIPYPYIFVRNKTGDIVGPKPVMHWESNMKNVGKKFARQLQSKSKAAAWIVSNCITLSNRERYVKLLNASLAQFSYGVDVFGLCGPSKDFRKGTELGKILKKDYYFYLSFESSFAKDYVTEKLLTPLLHNTVPIVLGGANYSRFLPPGSYLNALDYAPEQLSFVMRYIMWNPSAYRQFFRWRSHYTFEYGDILCDICAALNNRTIMETETVISNFKKWWNQGPNMPE